MAVGNYTLPICDGCRKPWLPDGWKPGDNPRALKAGRTLRCGKCKTSGWDREHNAAQRKAASPAEIPEVTVQDVIQTMDSPLSPPALGARCKHGLFSCPECHPQEDR